MKNIKFTNPSKEHLTEFRLALLRLHQTLLEYEKKKFEGKHGSLASRGVFLNMVVAHPSFAWLRQLSELIVGFDEMFDSKKSVPKKKINDFFGYTKKLLKASESGTPFEKQYYCAMQDEPAVILAHAKVGKFIDQLIS